MIELRDLKEEDKQVIYNWPTYPSDCIELDSSLRVLWTQAPSLQMIILIWREGELWLSLLFSLSGSLNAAIRL
jgi:hypothetical protein